MNRLTKIHLTGMTGTIPLPVVGVTASDRYILTGADGLGPPEIDVPLGHSVYRGGVYQGSFAKDREIVLLVSLNQYSSSVPTPPISALREAFYELLQGPEPVTITIYHSVTSDFRTPPEQMITSGYIRRIEIVPFDKDPKLQVTISCPSPYLSDLAESIVSLGPNTPSTASIKFPYYGTAITGFQYEFKLAANTSQIFVKTSYPGTSQEILTIPGPRVSGEIFKLNTNSDGRQVYWNNPSNQAAHGDITGMCTVTTDRWPSLHPGDNEIQVFGGDNSPLSVINTSMTFMGKYWGI